MYPFKYERIFNPEDSMHSEFIEKWKKEYSMLYLEYQHNYGDIINMLENFYSQNPRAFDRIYRLIVRGL
jgi:hypothetical protein